MPVAYLLQNTWTAMLDRAQNQMRHAAVSSVDFLFALLVVLVGWAIASLVARALLPLLRRLHFNDGVRGLLGIYGDPSSRHEPARLAASAAFWVILAIAVMLAMDVLGFALSQAVSDRLRDVVPRVVVATIMLVVGGLLAVVLGNVTRRLFESVGMRASRLRGQLVTAVLTAFAVLLALEQLGLAAQFIMTIMILVVGALALALGLAFGLGCRDLARDFVVEYLRSLDRDDSRPPQ